MRWLSRREPQIEDPLWHRLLGDYPFVAPCAGEQLAELRALTNRFLASKQFAGANGFEVDDYIGAAIALQACLPVLRLGLQWYDDFEQIVVYPDQFRVRGSEQDDFGLVHEHDDFLAGQAISGGPIVLSWADIEADAMQPGFNVVIHEFVHKLDLRDGQADGCPPLPRAQRERWLRCIDEAYDAFVIQCDVALARIPAHLDPDSEAAALYLAHLPLDPYAGEDPAEFFAVAGEALFTNPAQLRSAFPALFEQLRSFFMLP